MKRELGKYLTIEKYISIYTDRNDTTRFLFGKIIGLDDNYFALHSFSPNGNDDGILIKLIDDIFKLEVDNQYSRKMQFLMDFEECTHYDLEQGNVVISALNFSRNNNFLVNIELVESGINDVSGFVTDIKDNLCYVNLIDEYGYPDGSAIFNLDEIYQISLLSQEEKNIEKLARTNQG